MNKLNITKRDTDIKNDVLRSTGLIPGILYGPMVDNTPIRLSENELNKALLSKGEIYEVKHGRKKVMTKFSELQRHPVTKKITHFSLVELPKGMDSEVQVPVMLEGTPVGLKKGGVLVVLKENLAVHGTPKSIPGEIKGDISNLDIGDKLVIDDLNIPKKVDAVAEDDEVIAILTPPAKQIEESQEAVDNLEPPLSTSSEVAS